MSNLTSVTMGKQAQQTPPQGCQQFINTLPQWPSPSEEKGATRAALDTRGVVSAGCDIKRSSAVTPATGGSLGRRIFYQLRYLLLCRQPPLRCELIDNPWQVLAEPGQEIVARHAGLVGKRFDGVGTERFR